jgi:hypothetical protein
MAQGEKLDDRTRTELIGRLIDDIRHWGKIPRSPQCQDGEHDRCTGFVIRGEPFRCECACHGTAAEEGGN